ncbi:DUF4124 domain-containing protein [Ramlibacter sp. G-1-2-2]|uniref:DUF4124 domain-containing protein n=1 Tax=Ramlibacter agri TaxID=2728837 RepID=A0A848HB41_9BURK|nr:DUF4124 domain-containing protein [Ramlibacter agri]NML48246.1 DUF4124 domain-containing protein [Ramlibacter agri]
MKATRLVLAALLCTAPLLASAQWIWLDKDGRKVFSDQAPPPEIAPNRILKQAGQRAPAADAAPVAAATAATPTGKDKDLEAKKKEGDAAAAAKKKGDEEKVAQAKSDNCARAKSGKATYESGTRVVRTNDKGEREYLNDEERAREMKRLDGIIATDCH